MKVVVTGGRNFDDEELVEEALRSLLQLHGCLTVIHGDSLGADAIANAWAWEQKVRGKSVDLMRFPADWRKYGRKAGPLRNQHMLELSTPDLLLAFPGGRGTADCVKRAHALGIRVREVTR